MIFTTRHGLPVEPRNFNRSYDSRIASAGVPKITVHDAWRTCGSLLVDLDVHPRIAMAILRHADFSITMEIYSQVSSKANARPCGSSARVSINEPLLCFVAVQHQKRPPGGFQMTSDLRRDGRIRTDDPLTPSQVRYQAAPRPDAPAWSPLRQPVQLSAASSRRPHRPHRSRTALGIPAGVTGHTITEAS